MRMYYSNTHAHDDINRERNTGMAPHAEVQIDQEPQHYHQNFFQCTSSPFQDRLRQLCKGKEQRGVIIIESFVRADHILNIVQFTNVHGICTQTNLTNPHANHRKQDTSPR